MKDLSSDLVPFLMPLFNFRETGWLNWFIGVGLATTSNRGSRVKSQPGHFGLFLGKAVYFTLSTQRHRGLAAWS